MDLTGKKFNKLTAIEIAYIKKSRFWKCICDCGNETIVRSDRLKLGRTKSCGCLNKEHANKLKIINTKHAHTYNGDKSKVYVVWDCMKQRCYNVNHKAYKNYGGRGIKICERWLNSFENFLEDVGDHPGKDYSIDRIDNEGHYEPGNVKWSTRSEQNKNRRKRNNYLDNQIKEVIEL